MPLLSVRRKAGKVLYDFPEYYEVAFSFRDIPAECDFLHCLIQRFSNQPTRDILEIAAGPAPHAGGLIERGYRYLGLDINRNMLDYATYKWKDVIPRPIFIEGDMTDFTLEHKIDFAFVMIGSLYLSTMADFNRHFDTMARVMRPGALYFLDWCIQFTDPEKLLKTHPLIVERDGIRITSEFRLKVLDREEQMYEEIWTVSVDDHGRKRQFDMIERNRAMMPTEFLGFISNRPDFDFVGWWSEWDLCKPIRDGVEPARPVALIRRV